MTRDSQDQCGGCGSTFQEREKRQLEFPRDAVPTDIRECPHCGADKCCMCDMGDDVECGNCDSGDEG